MRTNIILACAALGGCAKPQLVEEAVDAIPGDISPPVIYYQAYDAKWDDPTINPIFDNEWEAKDYANRNNMGSKYAQDTSHSYVVRVINYRYEVRQVNDIDDDILHTTNDFNDAYEYVVEYSSAHSDLIIYDLKTGKQFEETPWTSTQLYSPLCWLL